MTIKQQGGVFGRNPTFNDVEVEGTLTVDGSPIPSPTDILTSSDIGSTVQGYDADTAKLDVTQSWSEKQTITLSSAEQLRLTGWSWTNGGNGASGSLALGSVAAYQGQIGYAADGNTVLSIDNTYNSNSAKTQFRMKTDGTPITPLTIHGDGDVELSNNLVFPSGQGIDFSATSGTGTSELFSDYEEGVFTPTYVGSGGNPTVAYLVQSGIYTKVGRLVTFRIVLITTSSSGGSGNLEISGLPFTVVSGQGASMQFSYAFASNVLQAVPGAPNIILYDTYAGTSNAQVQTSALTSAGGTTYLQFIGQYYV
jgi:hypothetical protein